jgi:hypothetical protein
MLITTAASHWLDIGIFASSLGILISLLDFILTSKQKKRIEYFIDNITLLLDYTKTLDWLQRWLKASRRASIAAVFFGIISVLLALGILVAVEWAMWSDSPWWMLVGVGILTLLFWGWQWGFVVKAYEHVGEPLIEALATASSYGSLIGGYVAVIFGGVLVLGLCALILYLVAEITANWWSPIKFWVGLGGNFVFGMFLCWLGIIVDGIATMIGALIVFVLRTVVDAARWLMWRVSTYPKGPLAATLTLVGAVLAVIKLLQSK